MPIDDATDRYLDRYGQSDDLDPEPWCRDCGEERDQCSCECDDLDDDEFDPDHGAEIPDFPVED